jgi:hypothetical protein
VSSDGSPALGGGFGRTGAAASHATPAAERRHDDGHGLNRRGGDEYGDDHDGHRHDDGRDGDDHADDSDSPGDDDRDDSGPERVGGEMRTSSPGLLGLLDTLSLG